MNKNELSEVLRPFQRPAEEEKKYKGHLRIQVIEESSSEAVMTLKVDDPMLKKEERASDMSRARSRKSSEITGYQHSNTNSNNRNYRNTIRSATSSAIRSKALEKKIP